MAGKNTKNPLLTGAGFQFENFPANAVLVPVSQCESSVISEEIEADSFLGQEPKITGSILSQLPITTVPVKQPYSTQSVFKGYPDLSVTPDLQPQVPSEGQLPISNHGHVPVFTQSLIGNLNPAKPTPVYADSLNVNFTKVLSIGDQQRHNNDPFLPPSSVIQPQKLTVEPLPTQPSQLLFTNKDSLQTATPAIFTPVQTSLSPSYSQPLQSVDISGSNPSPHTPFTYFSSPEQPHVTSISPSLSYSENVVSGAISPASVQYPPQTNAPPPSGGQQKSYRLNNIKRPVYTRPPELPVAPMATLTPPAPTSATMFTSCGVESLGTEAGHSISLTTTSPPSNVSYRFANKSPQSTSEPSVLPPSFANLAQGTTYRPVYYHWFFKKIVEGKVLWRPFSMNDSLALEEAFTSAIISPDTKVATDGGRYDVEVLRRRQTAVFWEEEHREVRRCSWFVKGSMDMQFVPYEENVATMLEEEYRVASTTNEWNRQVPLPDGEMIIIHSPNAIAHHTRSSSPDVWGNSPQMQQKPRVVKRGMDEFDISEGEPEKVDHLLFLVHGIGKFCDLKFRPVTEVVDDFRYVSLQLLQSHFKDAVLAGQVNRVEVLPVSWHQALHNELIDTRLNNITLQSIPRLRHFTNDTLLDILFYTSPVFCETIVQAVGNELNRLYNLFLSRNPSFEGGVSLGGHSLGSLILFDMLCNQAPVVSPSPTLNTTPSTPSAEGQDVTAEEEVKTLGCMKSQTAQLSRTVSYVTIGTAGTGQPFISYPQLVFQPRAFFALGSPIGMFVTVRGIESLGEDFALPTCPMFFNIFHPYDPVAYRVESLISAEFSKYSPVLIPHHKGRKRMHLELKDTLEHVGTALKQRLVESVRATWNTVYHLAMFQRPDSHAIEQEVSKVIESELLQSCPNETTASQNPDNTPGPDCNMGRLNEGRRIDYVLQEAPLESFNEYLFALSSHVCYWESEDTMLMMLKEIYGTMGIAPDSQVVQQILPFELPDGVGSSTTQYVPLPTSSGSGMDPTAPISDNVTIGPPPLMGFVKK